MRFSRGEVTYDQAERHTLNGDQGWLECIDGDYYVVYDGRSNIYSYIPGESADVWLITPTGIESVFYIDTDKNVFIWELLNNQYIAKPHPNPSLIDINDIRGSIIMVMGY